MRAKRRWGAWGAVALSIAVPALCCGPFFTEAVFVRPHRPDAPYSRFAAGRLGVLQPGYRVRHLAIAYDYLTGRGLSPAEQKDAVRADALLGSPDATDVVEPGFTAWQAARKAFGKVDGVAEVTAPGDRSIPGASYDQFNNCLDDAFATATRTLTARQAAHGAHAQEVVEWVRGQDAVFFNCGDTPATFSANTYHPAAPPEVRLPAVLQGAPPWLVQDRAYQIAAAHFYSLDYAEAQKDFGAISADRSSPWSTLAEYLMVRTIIREATLGDASVHDDAKSTDQQRAAADQGEIRALKQAQAVLSAMRDEPRMQPLKPALDHLSDWLALRVDPQAQARVLTARLTGADDASFGQDLIDLSFAAQKDPFPHEPPEQASASSTQSESGMWSWIGAVSTEQKDLSLAQWRATQSKAWLLAAMMVTQPEDSKTAALLTAANAVPASDPAYVAITYHRLRLTPNSTARRAQLEAVRAAVDSTQGPSATNLLAALDAASAPTLHDWLRTAGRKPAILTDGEEGDDDVDAPEDDKPKEQTCGPALPAADQMLFTPQAADALNTRMPLSLLAEAAESKELAPNLQFALAQATWTRSVLLQRPEMARRMTPLLVGCRPAWRPVLEAYDSAPEGEARHLAALLALMRFASTEPGVRAGAEREEGFATYSQFRDNWWADTVSPGASATANYDGSDAEAASPPPDTPGKSPLVTAELTFFSVEQRTEADAEIAALRKIPAASDYFATEALRWWRAHPKDPASAELLGEAMRVERNAPRTAQTPQSEHALFDALHSAFPESVWAKRYTSWE